MRDSSPAPTFRIVHLSEHPERAHALHDHLLRYGLQVDVERANSLEEARERWPGASLLVLDEVLAEADLRTIRANHQDVLLVVRRPPPQRWQVIAAAK